MSEQSEPERSGSERAPKQRRRRRVEGGRQHRHEVKVTPEEEGRLLQLALRYRVSIPKLLVDSALAGGAATAAAGAAEREALVVELFDCQRVLAGLANNVNQLARVANATGELRAETTATIAAARRLTLRIDELVDELTELVRR